MRKIHYKSDFALILSGIDFPDYNFDIVLLTDGSTKFTASYTDGVKTNVANCDGAIEIIADSHGLAPGYVRGRLTRYIPDIDFPDGVRSVVDEFTTDIVLTAGFADTATDGCGDGDDDSDDDSDDDGDSDDSGGAGGGVIYGRYVTADGASSSTVTATYEDPDAVTVLAAESDDVVITETDEQAFITTKA